MSWFKEERKTSYIRTFCNNVIKSGQIPKHVAIIMDGNRRFAKKVNCERSKGHEKGFEKLTEVRHAAISGIVYRKLKFPEKLCEALI